MYENTNYWLPTTKKNTCINIYFFRYEWYDIICENVIHSDVCECCEMVLLKTEKSCPGWFLIKRLVYHLYSLKLTITVVG
jgi:hypothetical protein